MRSFPWDSLVTSFGDDGFPIYDRDYMASDLREVYKTFFSNGVFMDTDQALQVAEGDGMNVLVAAGNCNINGTIGYEKNQRMLTIQASDTTYDRIDTVVLRWNANVEMRNIDLYVKTGVAQQVPVRPTLTRSETVFELGLGDVFVNKGAGAISAARITDTRLENERCGMVMPFASIDTTTFYNQIQAAIDDHIAILDEQTQKAVELAQSAIDGTTAGNLQNQITENKATDDERYQEFSELRDSQSQTFFVVKQKVSIGSIAANSVGRSTATVEYPDGYYPLCISSLMPSNMKLVISRFRLAGNVADIVLYNTGSLDNAASADVTIICVPNEMVVGET